MNIEMVASNRFVLTSNDGQMFTISDDPVNKGIVVISESHRLRVETTDTLHLARQLLSDDAYRVYISEVQV